MNDEKKKASEVKSDLNLNINPDTTPVLYTDSIFMSINDDGLVLDVCQRIGNTNQAKVVSRIGMSKEHARKFHKALGDLLENTQGRTQTGRKYQV